MTNRRSIPIAAVIAATLLASGMGGGCDLTIPEGEPSDAGNDREQQPDSEALPCGNLGIVPECAQCVRKQCCEPTLACSADPDCVALVQCMRRCVLQAADYAGCRLACRGDHPQGVVTIDAIYSCVADRCEGTDCGSYSLGEVFRDTYLPGGADAGHDVSQSDAAGGAGGVSGAGGVGGVSGAGGVGGVSGAGGVGGVSGAGGVGGVSGAGGVGGDAGDDEAGTGGASGTGGTAGQGGAAGEAGFAGQGAGSTGGAAGAGGTSGQGGASGQGGTGGVPDDPIAWLAFDEGTGSAALDSSGHGHDGTHNATYVAGKKGTAVQLGPTVTVTVPSSATLAWGQSNGDFTVEYWIRVLTASTGYQSILHHGNSDTQRTSAHFLGPAGVQSCNAVSTASNWNEFFCTSSYALGAWTHLADVKSGSTHAIYVNGALDSSKTLSSETVGFTAPLYLGKSPWWTGAAVVLDEVKVFDRALSLPEIQYEATP